MVLIVRFNCRRRLRRHFVGAVGYWGIRGVGARFGREGAAAGELRGRRRLVQNSAASSSAAVTTTTTTVS